MIVQELVSKVGFDFDENAFKKVENALASLGKGFAGIAAVVAGLGAGVAYEVGKIADVGFQASVTAQRLGVTTQALQEFQYVAQASGLEADAFTHGLQHLARLTFELSQGSSEAAMAFSTLGVSAYNASGKLKKPDELLEDIAERISKMPDGLSKTGLTGRIFGMRGGPELIAALNKGRAGIDALKQRAHLLGTVMSDDLIKRSKQYKQASIDLGLALDGLKIKMLGPIVGAQSWKVAATEGIVKYGDTVANGFQRVVHTFQLVGRLIGHTIAVIAMPFIAFAHAPWWREIEIAVIGLGALFLTLSLETSAAAIATVIAWSAAALPFIAVGLAIGALLLVLDDVYTYMKGGPSIIGDYLIPSFKDFFEKKLPGYVQTAWEKIKDFFKDLKNWALDLLSDVGKFLEDKIPGYKFIVDHVVSAGGDVASALVGGGAVSPAASANISNVGDTSKSMVYAPQITVNAPTGHADAIADAVSAAMNDHWDTKMRETNAAVGGAR